MKATVTWGLLAAWAVHDSEELATMASWMRRNRPELERRFPWIRWDLLEMSQAQVTVAIGLMGALVAAASAAGARSGGRSRFYQAALAGFGVHGAVHLAQAALKGGYTPGVLTAPTVVLPFSVWAWRRLAAEGVPTEAKGSVAAGVALFLAAVGGVHGLARLLIRGPGRWF
ncbi:HXXEE domain-containing protein [Thermoactinospora rubra]|uniref:HXXEE domain-containing protein n=1 Tax=Thermoactinospora rubra TaxID=1088767 RepID=UPI00198103AF|nr:HXXEE domain-containing protein [Thermoactinospora rubra]